MSPRTLQAFYNNLPYGKIDILLAKHFYEEEALLRIREFFLSRDYDVLILGSDDLVPNYQALHQIVEDMKLHGDKKIISGWSLVAPHLKLANVGVKVPPETKLVPGTLITTYDMGFLDASDIAQLQYNSPIIECFFVGFSYTAMRREVVEQWKPKAWYREGRRGYATDTEFNIQMHRLGIKRYADLRAYIEHLATDETLLVNDHASHMEFYGMDGSRHFFP
jgi:hypothetical protein